MEIASFLRGIILSPAACLALPYFPHYRTNGTIFRYKVIEKWRALISSTTFVRNISHAQNKKSRYYHKGTYLKGKGKGKVHPCTGTEALYRPYGRQGK
jgi:hypothetical protein